MPISVTCPACGQRLKAKDTLAGRTVPCPKCGGKLQIPRAPEEEAQYLLQEPEPEPPPPAAPEPEDHSDDDEQITTRSRRKLPVDSPPDAEDSDSDEDEETPRPASHRRKGAASLPPLSARSRRCGCGTFTGC